MRQGGTGRDCDVAASGRLHEILTELYMEGVFLPVAVDDISMRVSAGEGEGCCLPAVVEVATVDDVLLPYLTARHKGRTATTHVSVPFYCYQLTNVFL